MNTEHLNFNVINNNDLTKIIDLFIDKVYNNKDVFRKFVITVNKLIDSLIDICIKNKINYFVNNNISFSSIKLNFKIELEKYLSNYLKTIYNELSINNLTSKDLNNINDCDDIINVLSKKKKVSFNSTALEYTYNKQYEKKSKKVKPVKIVVFEDKNTELTNSQKIAVLLKLSLSNKDFIKDFKNKIIKMCEIINNYNL